MAEAVETKEQNRIFNIKNLYVLGAGAVLAALAAFAAVEVASSAVQDGLASHVGICPEDGGSVMAPSASECN